MEADDDASLPGLWRTAEESRRALEAKPPSALSPTYLSTIESILAQYTTLSNHISSLSLFSINETLEDLTTSSLPYLLCDYHIATLTLRLPAFIFPSSTSSIPSPNVTPTFSPSKRKDDIATARTHVETFLSTLSSYHLLSPQPATPGATPHSKLWTIYQSDPLTFSPSSSASSDPSAARTAKLAQLKASQTLQQKLTFLLQNPAYANGLAGTSPADEELVRSVHMSQLTKTTHDAFQTLDTMNRELEVLALAPMAPHPDSAHSRTEHSDLRRPTVAGGLGDNRDDLYSERLDAPLRDISAANKAPLLSQKGKPLRPFTLTNTRQEIARGAFKPGHNLPTMSIEEYLAEEKRRGGMIEGGGQASWDAGEKNGDDEEDMRKVDEETYKARAWDEFKEDNPKGAGNTMNLG